MIVHYVFSYFDIGISRPTRHSINRYSRILWNNQSNRLIGQLVRAGSVVIRGKIDSRTKAPIVAPPPKFLTNYLTNNFKSLK